MANSVTVSDASQAPEQVPALSPRTIARGVGVGLFGRLGGRALHFLAMVILARTLGAEAFGLFAIGWTILRIGWIVLPLGTDRAVISFGASAWPERRGTLRSFVLRVIGYAMIPGAIAGAGLYLTAPWVARVSGEPDLAGILRLLAPVLPFAAGLLVAASATQISLRVGYTVTGQELLQPLLFIGGILFFVTTRGLTLERTVILLDATIVIAFGVTLGFVLWLFRGPGRSSSLKVSWWRFVLYASRVSGARLLFIPMMFSDRIFAVIFGSARDAGLYNASAQLSAIFAIVTSGFYFILAPAFSRLKTGGNGTELASVFHMSRRWMIVLTLPLAVVMFIMPDVVLSTVFGNEYIDAGGILRILVAVQTISLMAGPVGMLLTMAQAEHRWLRAVVVGAGVYILSIPVLGTLMGPKGVALGYGLALTTVYLRGRVWTKRDLHVGPDRDLWRILLAHGGIIMAMVIAARAWFGIHTIWELMVLIVVCYLVHFLLHAKTQRIAITLK